MSLLISNHSPNNLRVTTAHLKSINVVFLWGMRLDAGGFTLALASYCGSILR